MISVAEFRNGDRVWFKVLAEVIDVRPGTTIIRVEEEGGGQRIIDLDATDVELQAPYGWLPQPGDVWVMNGKRYFAFKGEHHFVILIGADGHKLSPADINASARDLTLADRPQDGGEG